MEHIDFLDTSRGTPVFVGASGFFRNNEFGLRGKQLVSTFEYFGFHDALCTANEEVGEFWPIPTLPP